MSIFTNNQEPIIKLLDSEGNVIIDMTKEKEVITAESPYAFSSDGSNLIDYSVYGDTYVKSSNLFDEIYNPAITDTINYKTIYVGQGTFTLSSNIPLNSEGYANLFFATGAVSSGVTTEGNGVYYNNPKTLTSTGGNVTIAYRNYLSVSPEDFNVMLEKGCTAHAYEPYYEKKQMRKRKNLFDKNNTVVVRRRMPQNGTGTVVTETSYNSASILFPVEEGKTYTISKKDISPRFRIATYANYPWWGEQALSLVDDTTQLGRVLSATLTVPTNAKYLMCYLYTEYEGTPTFTFEEIIDNLMIEEGIQQSPYEPYYQPIGVGNYYNKLDPYQFDVKPGETKTLNGMTVTAKKDGTLILDGQVSVSTFINLGIVNVKRGDILKGCPAGGSNSTYLMRTNGIRETTPFFIDTGNGATITRDMLVAPAIRIAEGYTCDNLIFKPMIYSSNTLPENTNLFNKDAADIANIYMDQNTGVVIDGQSSSSYSLIIPIPNAGDYIFSINHPSTLAFRNRMRVSCYNKYPEIGDSALSVDDSATRVDDVVYNTFTAPSGTKYIVVFLWTGAQYPLDRVKQIVNTRQIQLKQGSTYGSYQPHKQNYVIPIQINSQKNLLQLRNRQITTKGITFTPNSDGTITVDGTPTETVCYVITYQDDYIHPEKGEVLPINTYYNLSCVNSINTNKINAFYGIRRASTGTDEYGSGSFTMNNGDKIVIQLQISAGTYDNVIVYPQLEKGSSATDFQPHTLRYNLIVNNPLYYGDSLSLNDTDIDIKTLNSSQTLVVNTFTPSAAVKTKGYIDLLASKEMDNIYTVRYYDYSGDYLLDTEYVQQGKDAIALPHLVKGDTAQYDYEFVGWNLAANQTTADHSLLLNIQSDLDIYTAFSETLQTYTVYFYENTGDTIPLQTVTGVSYGGSATYTGSAPEKTGYRFTGWSPSPINISGDTSCYAQFSLKGVITDDWATISARSTAGTAANYYSVGDCKAVALNGIMGASALNTTLYVYILGFNHNSTYEPNGITFGGFKTAATNGKDVALCDSHFNTGDAAGLKWFNINHREGSSSWGHNYGGWKGCDMRYDILGSTDTAPSGYGATATTSNVGYDASATCATNPVANTLMSCLPSDLRTVMKPMTKYTDNVGNKSNIEVNVTSSIDYLPLLAEYEIFGSRSYANQYEQNKQAQYAYYVDGNNSKIKYRHSNTVDTGSWFERSPHYNYNYYFCAVYPGGRAGYEIAKTSYGVAPIFLV